jgi:hypothetical protein
VIISIPDISLCLRISPSLLVRLKCPVQTGARSRRSFGSSKVMAVR